MFGHVAISVDDKVYSYGTNFSHGPRGTQDWGVNLEAYLKAQNGNRQTDLLALDVTPEQAAALQKRLDANNPNAPGAAAYDLMTNSCVSVIQAALASSGILPTAPGEVAIGRGGAVLQRGAAGAQTPADLVALARGAGLVSGASSVGTAQVGYFSSLWGTLRYAAGSN